MKRVVALWSILMAVSLALGFWMSLFDWQTGRFANAAGNLAEAGIPAIPLWTLGFPLLALAISVMFGVSKIPVIARHWNDVTPSKQRAVPMFALLFGPVLALVLQGGLCLMFFEVIDKPVLIKTVIGIMFGFMVLVGNYVAVIRPGSNAGFYTPWTKRSESIWIKTHRLLGRGMVLIALACLIGAMISPDPVRFVWAFPFAMIAFKVLIFAYSWHLWRNTSQPQMGRSQNI